MHISPAPPPPGLPHPQPASSMPTSQPSLASHLEEFLELELLEDFDIIQAKRAVTTNLGQPNLVGIKGASGLAGGHLGNEIKTYLEAAGFTFNSPSPFGILGFSELDGPEVTTVRLEARRDRADKFISHWSTEGSSAECNQLSATINLACERCMVMLKDVQAKRRTIKGITKGTDHWRELSHDTLSFLTGFTPPGCTTSPKVATQFSNVFKQDLTVHRNLESIPQTRLLFSQLSSQPCVISHALSGITTPLITWGPDNPSQVLKVASTFRELHAQGKGPSSLSLLLHFNMLPGCTEAEQITDLWRHPFHGNRWKELVTDITLLTPPMLMILSGKNAPIHVRKGLAIITLGTCSSAAIPRTLSWQENIFDHHTFQSIWIEVPHEHRWHIYGQIPALRLPGLIHTDKPRPSMGSHPEDPWVCIKLHFNSEIGSKLMQDVVVSWIRKTFAASRAIVGLQSTLTFPGAKLLEMTSPAAAYLLGHLCKSCIIISNRMAVVDTGASNDTWAKCITETWEDNPCKAGIELSLRPSHPARSKKCAVLAATQEQISAARARKGHNEVEPDPNKPETLRATIDMPVPVDAQVDLWISDLMAHISQISSVPLTRQTSPIGMELGTWQSVTNFEGVWSGRVLVQCNTKAELYSLHGAIHNRGICIQGHATSLNVHSNYLDLGNYMGTQDL